MNFRPLRDDCTVRSYHANEAQRVPGNRAHRAALEGPARTRRLTLRATTRNRVFFEDIAREWEAKVFWPCSCHVVFVAAHLAEDACCGVACEDRVRAARSLTLWSLGAGLATEPRNGVGPPARRPFVGARRP